MCNHVLSYVQRKRITDWKRLVIGHKERAFIYGNKDNKVFYEQLKEGGTLWIVASISSRPPELVARMSVKTVLHRNDSKLQELGITKRFLRHFDEYQWIAVGLKDSEFFGYNCADKALMKTTFETTAGKPWLVNKDSNVWLSKHGKRFQNPTKISKKSLNAEIEGITAIEKLASTKMNSVFISWKWRDNTKKKIKKLAYSLAENGFMAWLDLLALPMSEALRKIQKNEQILESLLGYGYARCQAVIGVESKSYGTKSFKSHKNWTLREWERQLTKNEKIKRILFNPQELTKHTITSNADFKLINSNEYKAAEEFKVWFNKNLKQ